MSIDNAPPFPMYPCVCYGMDGECACPPLERALRTIAYTDKGAPMSPEQREWCKQEIVSVEGYSATDTEGDDKQLATTVLHAWVDYCRDKGMLA